MAPDWWFGDLATKVGPGGPPEDVAPEERGGLGLDFFLDVVLPGFFLAIIVVGAAMLLWR